MKFQLNQWVISDGAANTRRVGKICDFRHTTRYGLESIQDRDINEMIFSRWRPFNLCCAMCCAFRLYVW